MLKINTLKIYVFKQIDPYIKKKKIIIFAIHHMNNMFVLLLINIIKYTIKGIFLEIVSFSLPIEDKKGFM